jgi:hypothetical protein
VNDILGAIGGEQARRPFVPLLDAAHETGLAHDVLVPGVDLLALVLDLEQRGTEPSDDVMGAEHMDTVPARDQLTLHAAPAARLAVRQVPRPTAAEVATAVLAESLPGEPTLRHGMLLSSGPEPSGTR